MNPNNHAQTSNFKVYMSIFKDDIIYAQDINLPGISHSPVDAYSRSGKKALIGGDSYDIGELTIGFICDEQYTLYKKVLSHMLKKIHQHDGTLDDTSSFVVILEITNFDGTPVLVIEYFGCYITNVGDVQFASTDEDNEITFDLSIKFDDFFIHENTPLIEKIIKS